MKGFLDVLERALFMCAIRRVNEAHSKLQLNRLSRMVAIIVIPFFERNRFSCNLLCASFTRQIAHMQKGAFQNIQEPFQKSNSNFTSLRGALERLRSTAVASPPRQSGTTGLLLRPSSRACLNAAHGHLRRLGGDPPETQALERRCRARHEFR